MSVEAQMADSKYLPYVGLDQTEHIRYLEPERTGHQNLLVMSNWIRLLHLVTFTLISNLVTDSLLNIICYQN